MALSEQDLEGFRQQLLDLGRQLTSDFSELAGAALRQTGGETSGSLSNTPVHTADLGTDAYEQEVALSLLQSEERRLEAISSALQRLRDGTYGQCESCGRAISRERLHAVPYTRLCIDCARRAEQAEAAGGA
jgi:RNA polymerase-binding protein DksA